jgi:hypothetical protein
MTIWQRAIKIHGNIHFDHPEMERCLNLITEQLEQACAEAREEGYNHAKRDSFQIAQAEEALCRRAEAPEDVVPQLSLLKE